MMRLYVASPWRHREQAVEAADFFRAEGFLVGARWLAKHGHATTDEQYQAEAQADEEDVLAADAFVVLNTGRSEGKSWEASLAYHAGIPVIVVGERDPYMNLFHYMPGIVVVDTLEDADMVLRRIERGESYV